MINFINSHGWLRQTLKGLLILLIIAVILYVFALIFLNVWPPFGGKANKRDKLMYAQRTKHFDGKKFFYSEDFSVMGESDDPYADRTSGKGTSPEDTLPTAVPAPLESPKAEDMTLTWFGHSTVMFQMQGMNIMFDPVFNTITSPVSFIGPKRFSDIVMQIEELPNLDIVIITHDHYDHLDYKTIKKINEKTERFIVPLGVENHLERWGIPAEKITVMAWWEETDINGLTIACVPSKHFSGRGLTDQNATMWSSWVLKNEKYSILETGDSGYGEHFAEIYEKYGEFTLALMDCAQYNTMWHNVHMFPEETVKAAKDVHAQVLMPIHWGAFKLSNHAWDNPPERVVQRADEVGQAVISPKLGETVNWNDWENYQTRWWREYK